MQINNISNTNFQGSFFIKKATPELSKEIMQHTRQGRSLYENVERTGDLLVVVKNKLDNKVKAFLEEKNIKFEFFPQLNTVNGGHYVTKVHELQPLIADLRVANGHRRRIPKNQIAERVTNANAASIKTTKPLSKVDKSEKVLIENKPEIKAEAEKITKKTYKTKPIYKSADYVKNIATAFNLDLNRPVKNIRGVNVIEIAKDHRKIMISKPDEMGRHYVMVKTKNFPNDRLVLNNEGKFLYSMNFNDEIELFDKKFQALLEPIK